MHRHLLAAAVAALLALDAPVRATDVHFADDDAVIIEGKYLPTPIFNYSHHRCPSPTLR